MVVMLLFLVNKTQTQSIPHGGWMVASFLSIALYWLCWVVYFAGTQPTPMIYAMVILPPVAFLCAGAAEKIWPIPLTSAVFLVFHRKFLISSTPAGMSYSNRSLWVPVRVRYKISSPAEIS